MVFIISNYIKNFPPVNEADENGLIAIGGSYSTETLYNAYTNGIFPWFDETFYFGNKKFNFIHWFTPDPRFVIFKKDFRISKRLLRYYKKHNYKITINKDFPNVIKSCQKFHITYNSNTWISDEMIKGYIEFYKKGYILSVEVWEDKKLIGGLYGVKIGRYFSGESMFGLKPNISKFAFIYLANFLFHRGFEFIDCQVYSLHFNRFGGINIPREDFIILLKEAIKSS